MSLLRSLLPLKWSALRYTLRESWNDLFLHWASGRQRFHQSLLDKAEEYACTNLLREVAHLDGEIIECGVYRGHTLLRIAAVVGQVAQQKQIYGMDSFGGFPVGSVKDVDVSDGRRINRVQNKFQYAHRSVRRLERIGEMFDFNLRLVPGFFEDTLCELGDKRFCFVHLDCDIYESYKTCLNELYDRVVPGGLIVFDEYKHPVWPGASRAVDEFFDDRPESPEFFEGATQGNYFVRKQGNTFQAGHKEIAA